MSRKHTIMRDATGQSFPWNRLIVALVIGLPALVAALALAIKFVAYFGPTFDVVSSKLTAAHSEQWRTRRCYLWSAQLLARSRLSVFAGFGSGSFNGADGRRARKLRPCIRQTGTSYFQDQHRSFRSCWLCSCQPYSLRMVAMKVTFTTDKQELIGTVSADVSSSLAEYLNDLIHRVLVKDLPQDEIPAQLHLKLADFTIHATEDEKKA